MTEQASENKLHIDSDWKAEAQKEKERLAAQDRQHDETKQDRQPIEADFRALLGILAQQALMGLGMMGEQQSGRVIVDLEGSRLMIDLLGVLEEKTKGNLSDDEAKELNQVLTELRQRFVQIAQLVAQQGPAPAGSPEQTPPSSGETSGVVMP